MNAIRRFDRRAFTLIELLVVIATLSADRSMTGHEVPGQPDNTVCYLATPGYFGQNAKWDPSLCHGANAGNLVLGDGSVQQLTDAGLVSIIRNIPRTQTIDGTLRFYVP